MRETFGLDPASVLAETTASHNWVHPDDRARFVEALHRSADELRTLDEEVRVHGADGTVRWVRSIGHPRALQDGSVVWDGIALDVTARRETEAALERLLMLARQAEAAQSTLVTGEGGRLGRSLALIVRHLDALAVMSPPGAAQHIDAVRAELSALLRTEAAATVSVPLTSRQREVLGALNEGASNREIGIVLGIGEGTVKLHVAAILKKFGAPNRTAALVKARAAGLA